MAVQDALETSPAGPASPVILPDALRSRPEDQAPPASTSASEDDKGQRADGLGSQGQTSITGGFAEQSEKGTSQDTRSEQEEQQPSLPPALDRATRNTTPCVGDEGQTAREPPSNAGTASSIRPPALSSSTSAFLYPTPEELAQQLAGVSFTSTEVHAIVPSASETSPEAEAGEEEWPLKEIFWPPLPPTPEEAAAGLAGFTIDERLRVRVICQNRNGPCSLIALCNILILRSALTLPSHLSTVTYSLLSALLADYFLSLPSFSSALSLDAALSILPTTRSGLTLNPRFSAIDAFSGAGEAGELALFELAQIPLLHGWLADKQNAEEFEIMAGEKGCVDYDTALERLVEGTEIAGPLGLRLGTAEAEDVVLAGEVERRSKWSEEVQEKVRRATIIDSFLDASSTQLTYPGLFSLSSSPLLPPSGLAALFRNSHLSVLYRRPTLPPSASSDAVPTSHPELFTLVTDAAFAAESEIVWESLEDVDGGASEFYDAGLRKASTRGGDFVASAGQKRERAEGREDRTGGEEADLALAQQLQAEEDSHAASLRRTRNEREAREAREEDYAERAAQPLRPDNEGEREERRRRRLEAVAEHDPEIEVPNQRIGMDSEKPKPTKSRRSSMGGQSKGKKEKEEKCAVM